jgi:Na+/H+-translocating membrane pyrophosphatase
MVVNIGDVKGVAGDAFDYYLTLIPTTMITKMVMKCRYKALATIIITSKRMN